MTNWEAAWASETKNWQTVKLPHSHSLYVLSAVAWVSVAAFVFFAAFTVLANSDVASLFMIASLFVWLASGVAYIKIKRARKNAIKVIQ
jgi:hypothetical protein